MLVPTKPATPAGTRESGCSEGSALRLLQVVGGAPDPTAGVTGVERVAQSLVEGLNPHAFVHFVAYPPTGALHDWFHPRVQGVLPAIPRHRLDPAWVRMLIDFLRKQAIDVVLSHGLRFDFLCALACRSVGVPHVISRAAPLAGEVMPLWRKFLYGTVDTWTLHACSGIITVSEASRARMQTTQWLRQHRITVIPNGVRVLELDAVERAAARQALGLDDADFVVGGVGRLVPGKCFDRLVRIAGQLRAASDRPLVLVILGEGPEREALAQQARTAGVRLLLPGYVAAPRAFLGSFDVAVLPSMAEGLPLAVLESMALGVPTIATAVGGIPEAVVDGESGLLVPVNDDVSLARALQSLLDSEMLRHRLGTAAARRVREHFALDTMLADFAAALWRLSRCAGRPATGETRRTASP